MLFLFFNTLFFWSQMIFLTAENCRFSILEHELCNDLQRIVTLSVISATGQRDTSLRISKCPTVLLQSIGSWVECVMQPNVTWGGSD